MVKSGCKLDSGLCVNRGWGLWRCRWRRGRFLVAASDELIVLPAPVGVDLGLGKEFLGVLRLALGQHLEAVLGHQVILDLSFGSGRIQLERVFAAIGATRVKAVKQPLAGLNRQLLLSGTHARIQSNAMSDAMTISNDQGRAWIRLG